MGVRGLQFFIDTCCPETCRQVSISEMAETFRRRHNQEPVVAVDGMGCIRDIYGDLSWVFGGQWREFVQAFVEFVNCFRQLGIELVFFFDGTTLGAKRRTWCERRLESMRQVKTVFEKIRDTGREPGKHLFQLPSAMGTLARFVVKYVCRCKVRTTLRECDDELSEYARKQNCMALLANDTDFIVTDTAPYLSSRFLNLVTMTTVLYDRHALASNLALQTWQLPLLACLRGNDVVPVETLEPFHLQLCRDCPRQVRNVQVLFPRLAGFVDSQPWRERDFEQCLELVAGKVFVDPETTQLLKKGLATYGVVSTGYRDQPASFATPPSGFVPVHDPRVTAIAKERHVNADNQVAIYSILCGYEYDSSATLEDKSDDALPPSALLFRPIRQRMYSLLLGDRQPQPTERPHAVLEWCAYAGNRMEHPEVVPPLPLDMTGGGTSLEVLWLEDDVDELKWSAFFACLETSFGRSAEVATCPNPLLVVCCIVNYLILNVPSLMLWEAWALVAQAVHPFAKILQQLRQLRVERVIPRAVALGSVFMRGVSAVQCVLGVCNVPMPMEDAMPWLFFDGKLFHHCYVTFDRGAKPEQVLQHQVEPLEEFDRLMSIAVTGTRFAKKWDEVVELKKKST